MSAQWKVGIRTFILFVAFGLIIRALLLALGGRAELFWDIEAIGITLMIAFFIGLGFGSRA